MLNQNNKENVFIIKIFDYFKTLIKYKLIYTNKRMNKTKKSKHGFGKKILKIISPKCYVKTQYKFITGHKLNFKNPVRYTEKLQCLRLFQYPKNDLVISCADRVKVRKHLEDLGLEKYLVGSLGVFNNFNEIDFEKLPKSFVMKCSHACGFNLIVKDKAKLNIEETRKTFNKWLKTDYGKLTVEPHYSKIKPKIIIEEYLGESPLEYKIHVFNGKAKYLYVVSDRNKEIHYNNLYINWEPFDGAQFNGWTNSKKKINKPSNFDEMVSLAEKLGKDFPFVRVDLYNINGKIYFGEMTFTPAKGTLKFDDDAVDFEIGNWLKIN